MTKKVNEISTGDYYSKAHKAKIKAAAGMMFADPAKPETQKAMRDFKNRDAGMKRVAARSEKARAVQAEKDRADALAADRENLPGLMAQYQKLRKEFDPNFEYSDDHGFWRKQKDIQGQLSALQARINKAGGKVSEDAAIKAFLDKGGTIQKLPYKKPRKADKTDYGSKHIGTLGGKGTKGQVTGRGANTRTGNKPVVSAEGFNPEYDDEAGMAHNSLQTIHRATVGLSKVIGEGDNLPEWCQEKLSLAENYLVTVWDYLQSEQGVAEGLPQTLRKVVPGYAKHEIDKKMDAGKFGKTDADKDANFQRYKKIQDKLKEQGVAEGEIERQHGDLKPWAYWSFPERVAKKLYQIHKGQPIDKSAIAQLWKSDGPDRMTKFMMKPDVSAILSAYEQMSDQGPLFKEGDMKEWKKGVKAPVKPRNFVAKNATTGGAGAHKDKKKDAKQGKVKHKKKPELAETATYDRRLNVLLEAKVLAEQIRQYRKK